MSALATNVVKLAGIVGEVRDLKAKATQNVWARSMKLKALGIEAEFTAKPGSQAFEDIAKKGTGAVLATGHLSVFNGNLKLELDSLEPLK